MEKSKEEEFRKAVLEIYNWVDQEIASVSPRCEISGRCCRFREYGHRLYITRVESDLLFEKELPEDNQINGLPDRDLIDKIREVCPYQSKGLCTARENRPLGCRIYFCAPDHQEKAGEVTEEALKRLKETHVQYGQPWEYNELGTFFVGRT